MKLLMDRIKQKLAAVSKKHKLSQKVQRAILKTLREDRILPDLLKRHDPGSRLVRFTVNNDHDEDETPSVFCFIGPRDWQWDRKTGECIGSGLCV